MKNLSVIIFISLIIHVPLKAISCECMKPDIKRSWKNSSTLFLGEVTSASEVSIASNSDYSLIQYQIKISRTYKGLPADKKEITVYTSPTVSACGIQLNPNQMYLIDTFDFFLRDGKLLMTSRCSSTRPVNKKLAKDVEWLNNQAPELN